ncbi:tRNA-uridine aminocarboxypropyltransferase [Sorangium sp. So ce1182]|uniref:tRNA-uridine aminocarboxypropyltransferase n=1 Tax=Sorangium sp. So ce1182 TaxID=3133334 RepID=UPI003F61D89C
MTFVPLQPPDLPPIRARGTPRCRGCGLPQEMCLCGALPRLSVRTRVVLLTHRIERTRSTNTGRLVARLLEGAEVRVRGEVAPQPRSPLPEGRRLMLFPSPGARALSPDDARGEPVVLLVPDGNWNQARRAFHRDPDARGAEPVTLPEGAPSRYGLRRAPHEGALSTLEAVARALGLLEGAAVERRMMEAFDVWVHRATCVRLTGKLDAGAAARREEEEEEEEEEEGAEAALDRDLPGPEDP